MQPDYIMKDMYSIIQPKCRVIYYPLNINAIDIHLSAVTKEEYGDLYIVWPHRWEFDKNPDTFFTTLCKLQDAGYQFKVGWLDSTTIIGRHIHSNCSVYISDQYLRRIIQ